MANHGCWLVNQCTQGLICLRAIQVKGKPIILTYILRWPNVLISVNYSLTMHTHERIRNIFKKCLLNNWNSDACINICKEHVIQIVKNCKASGIIK